MGNRGLIFPFLIHTLPPFFMTGPEADQIFPVLDIILPMKDSILMGDLFSIWWLTVVACGPALYQNDCSPALVYPNSFELALSIQVYEHDSPRMMRQTLFLKVTFICCNEIRVMWKTFLSFAEELSSDTRKHLPLTMFSIHYSVLLTGGQLCW